MTSEIECPCGRMEQGSNGKDGRKLFSKCCEPFIQGDRKPDYCEQLMRSRYSAYTLGDADYLIHTWHPSKQALLNRNDLLQSVKETEWLKLDVVKNDQEGTFGSVEFNAFYRHRGSDNNAGHATDKSISCMHEVSRFEKIADQWYYLDGELDANNQIKVGRNDPCLCGSGKKYKKCCDR